MIKEESKICTSCGVKKSNSSYGKRSASKDGLSASCKICLSFRDEVKYERNKAERIRRSNLFHKTEAGKKSAKASVKKWVEKNVDRKAAHLALRLAVKKGLVMPWPVCAIPECSCIPVAHHPDYSRPLDVVWLCDQHHKDIHRSARRIGREIAFQKSLETKNE